MKTLSLILTFISVRSKKICVVVKDCEKEFREVSFKYQWGLRAQTTKFINLLDIPTKPQDYKLWLMLPILNQVFVPVDDYSHPFEMLASWGVNATYADFICSTLMDMAQTTKIQVKAEIDEVGMKHGLANGYDLMMKHWF